MTKPSEKLTDAARWLDTIESAFEGFMVIAKGGISISDTTRMAYGTAISYIPKECRERVNKAIEDGLEDQMRLARQEVIEQAEALSAEFRKS